MYFDTHAHYDDPQFSADRDELLLSMKPANVGLIMNCGTDLSTSRFSVELGEKYYFIYAAVGFHPEQAGEMDEAGFEAIKAMAAHSKVRAIGEIGLDYHYEDGAPASRQKEVFARQLELAKELSLPAIVHVRDACQDALDVIAAHPGVTGVLHCFGESWETARFLLDRGWYLSFTGSVTFKNAKRAPITAEKMPLDRMMLETDSPYMSPVPLRGKRNDSRNVRHICDFIAALRGMSAIELEEMTYNNGKRFFGIEP